MAGAALQAHHRSPDIFRTLNTLFPDNRNPLAKFHRIIIHSKVLAPLNRWTRKINAEHPEERRTYFRSPQSRMKLTPLMVAVIAGNRVAVTFFARLGDQLKARDARRWTPLHHAAALGDRAMYATLSEKYPAALEMKTVSGGTPPQLLEMQQEPTVTDHPICQFYDGREFTSCTSRQFKERTGAVFTSHVYAPTNALYTLWLRPPQKKATVNSFDVEYVFPHLEDPRPLLAFQAVEGLGYGLVTCEPVEAGQILGEYCGELIASVEGRDTEYTIAKTIDGNPFRNLFSMANDSVPNATISYVYCHNGLPLRVMIAATRAIPRNGRVTICYGPSHRIKHTFYRLLPGSREDLSRLFPAMKARIENPRAEIPLTRVIELAALSSYIGSTPRAFIQIALDIPDSLEILRIISQSLARSQELSHTICAELLDQILGHAAPFNSLLSRLTPPQRDAMRALAFHLIDRHEAAFAWLPLQFLSQFLRSDRAEEFLATRAAQDAASEFRGSFETAYDEIVIVFCKAQLRHREEMRRGGATVGPGPFDLKATIRRISGNV